MPTEKPRRAYNTSSMAMIVGISAITDAAIAHADELGALDTRFNTAYFQELRGRIDIGSKRLGADNAGALRAATDTLEAHTDEALTELRLVKLWIEGRFSQEPVRRDELLNKLGFTALYREASRNQQTDLRQLLLRFREATTVELSRELTDLGLPATRITKLQQLANEFSAADSVQERQKKERGELTETDVTLLNGLYAEVMGIAKMAQKLFEDRPAIQAGFVFERTIPGGRRS